MPNESPSQSRSEISPRLVDRILELLAAALPWEARLQLLQSIASLPIAAPQAERFCDAVLGCLEDKNKFIRAWAYTGLHHLASLHPEYRAEVRRLLQRAVGRESTAVRARLRLAAAELDSLGDRLSAGRSGNRASFAIQLRCA